MAQLIPNRLIAELGEAAARFNRRTQEHTSSCCHPCRRLIADFTIALTDPSNWEPDPPHRQIEKLEDEVKALKEMVATGKAFAPIAPVPPITTADERDDPQGGFFPPPPRGEDD